MQKRKMKILVTSLLLIIGVVTQLVAMTVTVAAATETYTITPTGSHAAKNQYKTVIEIIQTGISITSTGSTTVNMTSMAAVTFKINNMGYLIGYRITTSGSHTKIIEEISGGEFKVAKSNSTGITTSTSSFIYSTSFTITYDKANANAVDTAECDLYGFAYTANGGGFSEEDLENARQEGYNEGYTAGESAGYENGYNAGYTAGQAAGYDEGYAAGYNAGKTDGLDEGYQNGYNTGKNDGLNEGGYNEGYSAGHTAGYDEGYAAGFAAGKTEGNSEGYESGKTDGLEEGYQSGYQTGYQEGYIKGEEDITDLYTQIQTNIFYLNPRITTCINNPNMTELKNPNYTIKEDGSIDIIPIFEKSINDYNTKNNTFINNITKWTVRFEFNNYQMWTIEENCITISGYNNIIPLIQITYLTGTSNGYGPSYQTLTATQNNDNTITYKAPTEIIGKMGTQITIRFSTEDALSPIDYITHENIANVNIKGSNMITDASYKAGFLNGVQEGINLTKEDIQTTARQEGYQNGLIDGKKEGLAMAQTGDWKNLILAVVETPINAFQSLFNFEILGLNMQAAIGSILTLCVLLIILKKVL